MTIQERFNEEYLKSLDTERGARLPSCMGPCSECDARELDWAERVGCTVDELYEAIENKPEQ